MIIYHKRGEKMSEKLFYKDAYIKEFDAECISCRKEGEYFAAVLDKTAFFPEGGGQTGDTGALNGVKVTDTQEINGEILHILEREIPLGAVHGVLNWDKRFAKMQNHTAEHIVSGTVNKRFGLDNVGFHLGDGFVTMDYNGTLTKEDVLFLESEVNEILWRDLPVKAYFPQNTDGIVFRSKIDIKENLRIVEIPGVDVCACCAPHVSSTAQAGIIKIINSEKHKNGVRLTMKSGAFALNEMRILQKNTERISHITSLPSENCADGVEKLAQKLKDAEFKIKDMQVKAVLRAAEESEKNYMFVDDASLLKDAVNALKLKFGQPVFAFAGAGETYRFMALCPDNVKEALQGKLNIRCGGRDGMIQGSVAQTKEDIENALKSFYFEQQCSYEWTQM